MSENVQILTEIKEQLEALNNKMEDVKTILQNDRSNLWKILGLTIAGAFALIGIKMAFP
jgi:phage terminase Nu1 subunit (DNA packaging protein)